MTDPISRHIKIGDWYFEVKMVRALKVDEYGQPYEAIANCNINGDSMYVDGLLTKDDKEFTREDFLTFSAFSKKMGLDSFSYHRYQNGQSVTKEVFVNQQRSINNAEADKTVFVESPIRVVK